MTVVYVVGAFDFNTTQLSARIRLPIFSLEETEAQRSYVLFDWVNA